MSSLHVEGVAEKEASLQPRGLGYSPDQSTRLLMGPPQPPHRATQPQRSPPLPHPTLSPPRLLPWVRKVQVLGQRAPSLSGMESMMGFLEISSALDPWCPRTTVPCLCKLAIAIKSQRYEHPKGSAEFGTSMLQHHKCVLHGQVASV